MPHIGVDDAGTLGRIDRPGQTEKSGACGALVRLYKSSSFVLSVVFYHYWTMKVPSSDLIWGSISATSACLARVSKRTTWRTCPSRNECGWCRVYSTQATTTPKDQTIWRGNYYSIKPTNPSIHPSFKRNDKTTTTTCLLTILFRKRPVWKNSPR